MNAKSFHIVYGGMAWRLLCKVFAVQLLFVVYFFLLFFLPFSLSFAVFVRSIRNETNPNAQNPCCGSFVVNWNWNRKWEMPWYSFRWHYVTGNPYIVSLCATQTNISTLRCYKHCKLLQCNAISIIMQAFSPYSTSSSPFHSIVRRLHGIIFRCTCW